MSRIPLADPQLLGQKQKEQYDRFPSNLTRTLLLAPERLATALPETANALRTSELDPAWREGIILRVAALHDSAYERMQHLDQVTKVGWSKEHARAIEAGETGGLPEDFAKVLAFVDACVAGTKVSDETFAGAHGALSDRDLVTVILLIGHYMTVARLTGILDVELDLQPDSWTAEH